MLYRINVPILVIQVDLDRQEKFPVRLPVAAVISVGEPATADGSLLHANWQGKNILLFAVDLEERGEIVTSLAQAV